MSTLPARSRGTRGEAACGILRGDVDQPPRAHRLDESVTMNRSLRVWAPEAKRVDVVVGEEAQAAVREAHGWWRGPRLHEGDLYWIRVDNGPPRPDPRSA